MVPLTTEDRMMFDKKNSFDVFTLSSRRPGVNCRPTETVHVRSRPLGVRQSPQAQRG